MNRPEVLFPLFAGLETLEGIGPRGAEALGALGVTLVRRQARVQAEDTAAPIRVLFHGTPLTGLPEGAVALVAPAPGLPLPQGGNAREIELLALDQAAWALGGRLGLDVADNRTELDWAVKESRPIVWAPARMTADVAGLEADPLALAVWLAEKMRAVRLDLALPRGALARVGRDSVVFAATAGGYRVVTVEVLGESATQVVVRGPLAAGTAVAVAGTSALKALLAAGE